MTNKNINDYLKDVISYFRKYRDQRPITDEKLQAVVWDGFYEIIAKYAEYEGESVTAMNQWIIDTAIGLYRELEMEEKE